MREVHRPWIDKDETLDDLIIGGLKIIQAREGYRFSLDAVLLAHYPDLQGVGNIIDLGTGSGVIPLLLSARTKEAAITGLELQSSLAERAIRSVVYNQLQDRIRILHGDIRELPDSLPGATADLVVSNPPFWRKGEGKLNKQEEAAIARHELYVDLEQVIAAAAYLMVPAGRFCFIQRAARLDEVWQLCTRFKLRVKKLRMVHAFRDRPATMVLIEAHKQGRFELSIMPPLVIYEPDGEYCAEIKELYDREDNSESGKATPGKKETGCE